MTAAPFFIVANEGRIVVAVEPAFERAFQNIDWPWPLASIGGAGSR
jgi:hypothetical protein